MAVIWIFIFFIFSLPSQPRSEPKEQNIKQYLHLAYKKEFLVKALKVKHGLDGLSHF